MQTSLNFEKVATQEEKAKARKNARKKERYAADPEYRAQKSARENARHKERLATDPEYRAQKSARENARHKERLATDPEYRERTNARQNARHKERYATDPNYRAQWNARQKERYATDPEYRARHKARANARHKERLATDPETFVVKQKIGSARKSGTPVCENTLRKAFRARGTHCPACGQLFKDTPQRRGWEFDRTDPDPKIGYIGENVECLCNDCNRKKSNWRPEEMAAFANAILARRFARQLAAQMSPE